MLTLDQIKNISFHKARREGYQPEEVDTFIDDVVAAFEAVLNERVAMRAKLEAMERDLTACRARESSVGEALLAAQHQADVMRADAQTRADAVVADAQTRADGILADAKAQASAALSGLQAETERQQQTMRQLRQEVSAFRGRLLKLYREHLTLIDALPSESAEPAPQPAAETEKTAPVPDPVPAAEPAAEIPAKTPVPAPAAAVPVQTPVPNPVPEIPAAAEPAHFAADTPDPVDLSSNSTQACSAGTEYGFPSLFTDDAEPEEPRQKFDSLQFGADYEEPTSGFFHRKK